MMDYYNLVLISEGVAIVSAGSNNTVLTLFIANIWEWGNNSNKLSDKPVTLETSGICAHLSCFRVTHWFNFETLSALDAADAQFSSAMKDYLQRSFRCIKILICLEKNRLISSVNLSAACPIVLFLSLLRLFLVFCSIAILPDLSRFPGERSVIITDKSFK